MYIRLKFRHFGIQYAVKREKNGTMISLIQEKLCFLVWLAYLSCVCAYRITHVNLYLWKGKDIVIYNFSIFQFQWLIVAMTKTLFGSQQSFKYIYFLQKIKLEFKNEFSYNKNQYHLLFRLWKIKIIFILKFKLKYLWIKI